MIIGSREKFKILLIERLGEPYSDYDLQLYLDHIIQANLEDDKAEHIENHHVLPRSIWPELANEDFNQKRLFYSDHVKAHYLLAKAYPIPQFLYPLNWMLVKYDNYKNDPDYLLRRKESFIKTWERLKEDSEWFESFCKSRSDYMKEAMKPGHPHYEKMVSSCKKVWEDADEDYINWRSDINKKNWENKTEDDKMLFIERLKITKNSPEQKEKASINSKKMWESEEFRKKHKISMERVITTKEYKDKQSQAHKKLWSDEKYRKKMLERKSRGCDIIEITFPDGEVKIEYGMANMLNKYKFCRKLVLKYIDTNEVVKETEKYRTKCKLNTFNHKFRYLTKV